MKSWLHRVPWSPKKEERVFEQATGSQGCGSEEFLGSFEGGQFWVRLGSAGLVSWIGFVWFGCVWFGWLGGGWLAVWLGGWLAGWHRFGAFWLPIAFRQSPSKHLSKLKITHGSLAWICSLLVDHAVFFV